MHLAKNLFLGIKKRALSWNIQLPCKILWVYIVYIYIYSVGKGSSPVFPRPISHTVYIYIYILTHLCSLIGGLLQNICERRYSFTGRKTWTIYLVVYMLFIGFSGPQTPRKPIQNRNDFYVSTVPKLLVMTPFFRLSKKNLKKYFFSDKSMGFIQKF